MSRQHTISMIFFVLILLMGCQISALNPSSFGTPTPSWGVQTKDADYLRPALFKEEDMNWEVGTYREMTAGLNNDWEFNEGKFYADDVMGAVLEVYPSVRAPKKGYQRGGFLSAGQTIMLYVDEATAIRVGELEKERSERIGIIGTQNGEPRLNIVVESCWGGYNKDVGNYQNCNFWGQHGRYVMLANMTVDGEIITMEDWSKFIDVIQDRLIAQVEKEAAATD